MLDLKKRFLLVKVCENATIENVLIANLKVVTVNAF